MEDVPDTCGKGLAQHSALPAKLGEVMASVAEVLESHTGALDLTDESSRKELEAYVSLATQHREIARQLHALAREMAGSWSLPMGRHDRKAMADPRAAAVFEQFVSREEELLTLLQGRLERDRRLLGTMRRSG